MDGITGAALNSSPSTRRVSNDTGGVQWKYFSGFDTPNRDNSDENKIKKTKHSHSTINDFSFSQFPSHMRFDLERTKSLLYIRQV